MNAINKLNQDYRENKLYYLMVLIFFCVGIALGTYMVKYMSASDTSDLASYFSSFIEGIIDNPVDSNKLFFSVLRKSLPLVILIILFGFTFFGVPLILLIDLIKGFTLGYTFSFLLTTIEGSGVWLAIAAVLPQNILYIPTFIAISIISIEFSSNKLRDKFFNKNKTNRIVEKKVIYILGVFLCLFILGTIIETFLSPKIIKFVITRIYKIT